MKALRRVLLVIAGLMAVTGIVISLLPYDTTVAAPAMAGQTGLTAEVSCQAPLVDLFSDESDDTWWDYGASGSITIDSVGRSGGELCADTMRTRGIIGVVLVMGAVCFAAAALVGGRRPDSDDAGASERSPAASPVDGPTPEDSAR